MGELRPNKAETIFLNLAYNRFYDIYDEIFDDSFWQKDKYYRFCKIKDGFAVYTELLNYEPIKWILEWMKKGGRPPIEGQIAEQLFRFIRNILMHFPFYESWDDVWITKEIINWSREKRCIDKFLRKYEGQEQVKYRFWESSKKHMTYLSIRFPSNYLKNKKIFLKNIVSEKEGVKFSFILMKKIADSQVEEIEDII